MLLRQGRLSTMPCPDNFIKWLKGQGAAVVDNIVIDIRKLLKRCLFEATNYCGYLCYLTQNELDLIQKHC